VKTLVTVVFLAGCLLLPPVYGQRGGGGGAGHGGAPGRSGPRPGVGRSSERFQDFELRSRFFNGYGGYGNGGYGYGGYGYGDLFGDDSGGYPDMYPAQSSPPVVIMMPAIPIPPPPPPSPVSHEYSWPGSAQSSGTTFAIASKDGSVRYAGSVWVSNGALQYTDPDGAEGRLDLGAVDRETTRRLNAERGLTLQIPVR
jgi:hypothetical protein